MIAALAKALSHSLETFTLLLVLWHGSSCLACDRKVLGDLKNAYQFPGNLFSLQGTNIFQAFFHIASFLSGFALWLLQALPY